MMFKKIYGKRELRALPLRFGCDIADMDIPKDVERAMVKLGLGKRVLNVPKRKNGLTSSGKISECHSNVALLVKEFRGKHLRGFMIDTYEKCHPKLGNITFFVFMWHSVWITPEGNAVCATKFSDRAAEVMGFEEYVPFIPIGFTDEFTIFDGEDFRMSSIHVKKIGICLDTGIDNQRREKQEIIPFNRLKPSTIMDGCRFDPSTPLGKAGIKKRMESLLADGGFSEPSLATGRYLVGVEKAA